MPVETAAPNPTTGFLSGHDWLVFGAFMLLLFGVSILDKKTAVYIGIGVGVVIIAQHV